MPGIRQVDLLLLVRAYQSGESSFPKTAAARRYTEDSGFGRLSGSKWLWDDADRLRIGLYLQSHGIDDPDRFDVNFGDKTRIETAETSAFEKFAGKAPRSGRVLIRSTTGSLAINGLTLPMIDDGCLDIHVRSILSIEHDCLIVVENFEAVTGLEKLVMNGFPYRDPLIVYRGDAINPGNGAIEMAKNTALPVIAFSDFDPQGLNIALSTPNVRGALLPASYDRLNRPDLFLTQRGLLGPINKYPVSWRPAIAAMLDQRQTLTQENMIARGVPCAYLLVR